MSAASFFLRGLLLQAGWSRERMQALGFGYTLLPLAAALPAAERAAFIRRHLRQVNTNPALAGILVGVVAAEEERLAGSSGAESSGEGEGMPPAAEPAPPAEGSAAPPAEGGAATPAEGGAAPPAEGSAAPPAEGSAAPPAEGSAAPPASEAAGAGPGEAAAAPLADEAAAPPAGEAGAPLASMGEAPPGGGPAADVASARVGALKRRLEGPLAALGDRCFWGWARPILGVLGAFLILAGATIVASGSPDSGFSALMGSWSGGWALASMLAALVFYNVLHLATRWRAVRVGLAIGHDPGHELEAAAGGFGVRRLTTWLELMGPLLLGALAGQLLLYAGQAGAVAGGRQVAAVALLIAGILIGVGAERRFRLSPERVGMVVLVVLLIAAGWAGRG